jgi:sterol desaturase/sphingolipid hydroxylase (fatty acid hydroxylase superfamily)
VGDQTLARLYSAQVVLLFGSIALGMVAEAVRPRHVLQHPLRRRWLANGFLLVIDQLVLRLLMPLTVITAALLAEERGWGLLNLLALPAPIAFVASLLALDGAYYVLHRLEHRVPLLWRVHRLHHSDPDVDVSTGVRFHPLEALVQGGTTVLVALLIGTQPLATFAHLLLLALVGPFSHTNVIVPPHLERLLRAVIITPDMHRLHHSADPRDYETNYSLGLSFWDRLFGTYRAEPVAGYAAMKFGVAGRMPADCIALPRILADPLLP